MKFLKSFLESVAKAFSKFYNSLPQWLRVAIYAGSSFLAAKWLTYAIEDATALTDLNRYVEALRDAFVLILTAALNVVQLAAANAGQKLLAEQGDKKTIEKLETKVAETKAIIDESKK